MDGAVFEIQRDHTLTHSVLHDQIHCEVFDEVVAVVGQRLTVKRVKKRVAGSVKCEKMKKVAVNFFCIFLYFLLEIFLRFVLGLFIKNV